LSKSFARPADTPAYFFGFGGLGLGGMVGFPGSFAALFLPPLFETDFLAGPDFFAALALRVVFLRLDGAFFAATLFFAPAVFRRVAF
jgi:hypothetical protein